MIDGLVNTTARTEGPDDRRIYGIAVARVVNNVDVSGLARVQVSLSWLPQIEPWARLAVLMAGSNRGTYFVPQIGDEVLVAFNLGDINELYIVGCLWNGKDRPPTLVPTDAVSKRIIRTPLGHEVEFDDATQAITITSSTKQKITLGPTKVEMTTAEGKTTITLDTVGNVAIQGTLGIKLKAPTITIEGDTVTLKGNVRTTIGGGQNCDIRAGLVRINEPT